MSFSHDVSKWAVNTKHLRDDVVTLVFKRLGTLIVNRTPIGDRTLWSRPAPADYRPGSLVNNWFAGIGEPGALPRRGHNVNGADSLSQINAISKAAPGKLAYIANPLPYARRVEYGWSTQAPQGMVRISVAEFQRIVRKAVADVA